MDRDEGLAILASRGWLAGTPAEFRDRFLALAKWRQIEPGTQVTLGGEDRDDVIGLAQGTVTLTSALGEAGTPVMHLAQPVFWLGYGPLLLGEPRRISAEAKTPVAVALFPKFRVAAMLNDNPAWWRCFMPLLAEYGDISALIAADLLIRRSDQRLAATILRFAGLRAPRDPETGPVTLPVSQTELADASNLSRNSTGTILRDMEQRGWITIAYRSLVLHDPAALRGFVAGAPPVS